MDSVAFGMFLSWIYTLMPTISFIENSLLLNIVSN